MLEIASCVNAFFIAARTVKKAAHGVLDVIDTYKSLRALLIAKDKTLEPVIQDLENEPDIMCPGGSVIISPLGEVIAGPLWKEEGLLTADIDPDVLAKSKLDFDVVGHYARPDVFSFSVKNDGS